MKFADDKNFSSFTGIDYKTTTILLDGKRVKLQLWYEILLMLVMF